MKRNYRKSMYERYLSIIFPILQEYEKIRKDILKENRTKHIIAFILAVINVLCILTVVIIIKFNLHYLDFYFVLSMAVGVLVLPICLTGFLYLFGVFYKNNTVFKKRIKLKCMPKVVNCFGNLKWGRCISKSNFFSECNLFPKFKHVSMDDSFYGEYKGVEFEVHETQLSTDEMTVFKGVVLYFTLNKSMKSHTIIATRGDMSIMNFPIGIIAIYLVVILELLRFLSKINLPEEYAIYVVLFIIFSFFVMLAVLAFSIISRLRKVKSIKLEDVCFDKRFKVYSEDQVEARYLITPSFMERLYNIKTAFGAKNIKCSFYSDKIIFAIPTNKDLFEFGCLYKSLLKSKDINNFYEEIISIYRMINYFKLYQKTGI